MTLNFVVSTQLFVSGGIAVVSWRFQSYLELANPVFRSLASYFILFVGFAVVF